MFEIKRHPPSSIQMTQNQIIWHDQYLINSCYFTHDKPKVQTLPSDIQAIINHHRHHTIELSLIVSESPFDDKLKPLVDYLKQFKHAYELLTPASLCNVATLLLQDQRPFSVWFARQI